MKSNSFNVLFANNNLSNNFIRIDVDNDHWLAFTPYEKFTSPGISSHNSMQYKNVKQGMSIDYSVDSNRLKEIITLSSYPGSNTFIFPMSSKGLAWFKQLILILIPMGQIMTAKEMYY